jgi:hypothetical protein
MDMKLAHFTLKTQIKVKEELFPNSLELKSDISFDFNLTVKK